MSLKSDLSHQSFPARSTLPQTSHLHLLYPLYFFYGFDKNSQAQTESVNFSINNMADKLTICNVDISIY